MKCDICLEPHSCLWGFTIAEFMTSHVFHPAQEWAICEACRKLLHARDMEGLLERTDKAGLRRESCEPFLSGMILNISGPMVICYSSDEVLYPQEWS